MRPLSIILATPSTSSGGEVSNVNLWRYQILNSTDESIKPLTPLPLLPQTGIRRSCTASTAQWHRSKAGTLASAAQCYPGAFSKPEATLLFPTDILSYLQKADICCVYSIPSSGVIETKSAHLPWRAGSWRTKSEIWETWDLDPGAERDGGGRDLCGGCSSCPAAPTQQGSGSGLQECVREQRPPPGVRRDSAAHWIDGVLGV
jgi:hypothetical protein